MPFVGVETQCDGFRWRYLLSLMNRVFGCVKRGPFVEEFD